MSLTNINEMLNWVQENEGEYVKLIPVLVGIKSDCTIQVVNFSDTPKNIDDASLTAVEVTDQPPVETLDGNKKSESLLDYTKRLESRIKSNSGFFKS